MYHRASCDACGGEIGGARISCLTCQIKKEFSTLDFCQDPDCISVRVFNDELFRPHQPAHDLVKLRRVVHLRQFGQTYRDAKEALKQARKLFEKEDLKEPKSAIVAPSDDSGFEDAFDLDSYLDRRTGPKCANCDVPVTQPCWFCVQCESSFASLLYAKAAISNDHDLPAPSFICYDCDLHGRVKFGKHDFDTHDLVRCQEFIEEVELSVEDRLAELEQRFTKHEAAMHERLSLFESNVDDRLHKVEQLLEKIVNRFASV